MFREKGFNLVNQLTRCGKYTRRTSVISTSSMDDQEFVQSHIYINIYINIHIYVHKWPIKHSTL